MTTSMIWAAYIGGFLIGGGIWNELQKVRRLLEAAERRDLKRMGLD